MLIDPTLRILTIEHVKKLFLCHAAIGFTVRNHFCFTKILKMSKAISRITNPIPGIFVLI